MSGPLYIRRNEKTGNVKDQANLKELESLLGYELFFKVVERFAGKQLYFPKRFVMEKKREAIRKEYRPGARFGELADKYDYTEQHIRYIVREPQKIPGNEPSGRLSRLVGRILTVFRGQRGQT